jgi:hypothetical protein
MHACLSKGPYMAEKFIVYILVLGFILKIFKIKI